MQALETAPVPETRAFTPEGDSRSAMPEKPTGAELIAAIQRSPYRELEIEPERNRMPVRGVPLWWHGFSIPTSFLKRGGWGLNRRFWRLLPISIVVKPLEDLYISAVTLAELRFGIELLSPDTGHRTGLNVERRVLPITEDVMLRRRILVDDGRKAGLTYSQPDLIIAATAPHYDLTLVTRDRGDFEKARVPVLNPWDAS
jgi:predicted nucleic acid-binding protein